MTHLSWLSKRPIAHRGFHDLNQKVWENTLSAFGRAVERGYAIECDVHLTSDGDAIVFHDHHLRRLTGQDGTVWQRTAAEMKALKVGGTDDHPPTLAETLRFVAGRVPVVIELKGTPGHDEGLVARVGDLLRSYSGKAAIMSFDHWLIRDFSRHAPGVPAGLTAEGQSVSQIEAHFSMLANNLSFVSYAVDHLPNPFVSFVRAQLDMPVITWTVRDDPMMERTFAHADQMTFEGFEPEGQAIA
ncbi:glycerophosphodiester phosphodiesterase [Pseudaminobacter sp. 19-2017]|uniref:Glycerophosphodiester phosphodiesterase n=1 Tax=Pseudaminobacter soli (ex Zhang et al. 2022) TaxID=2831468 RepID=A0A942DYR9_9HYPH|nr:glycerophosphodiester phosphodiesterase [Pseudaminobacter soli]MBS3647500.1 glycerophosphodiester phosphodiesterase [Pseudaminobacter soli]